MSIYALILAGGEGKRFDQSTPKQYFTIGNTTILRISIEKFLKFSIIKNIMVIINKQHIHLYNEAIKGLKLLPFTIGGATRQESVKRGLLALQKYFPKKVLIHDAVRPNVSYNIISNVIDSLNEYEAVDVHTNIIDTVKDKSDIHALVDRDKLCLTQTPQGFNYQKILKFHLNSTELSYTDDIRLFSENDLKIGVVQGEKKNFKITTKEDLIMAEKLMISNQSKYRIGNGFDVHKIIINDGTKVIIPICGVNIISNIKVIAHSDGDVGIHALMDAILGALSLGDIGQHFPPNDEKWKNIDSKIMLKEVKLMMNKLGAEVENVDLTILCEQPKINPYKNQMIRCLAEILEIQENQVNVKATTTEELGFIGRKEGIAAQATCLLKF